MVMSPIRSQNVIQNIVALVTDDQDENGDTSDAETITYDNVDGPTAARQIPTDCVWQNKTFTPPDITLLVNPCPNPCFMGYHCK